VSDQKRKKTVQQLGGGFPDRKGWGNMTILGDLAKSLKRQNEELHLLRGLLQSINDSLLRGTKYYDSNGGRLTTAKQILECLARGEALMLTRACINCAQRQGKALSPENKQATAAIINECTCNCERAAGVDMAPQDKSEPRREEGTVQLERASTRSGTKTQERAEVRPKLRQDLPGG